MKRITIDEAVAAFAVQGVGGPRDYAVVCPICGTVQSMNTLVQAGVAQDDVHRYFGFSCEGRFTNAGPVARANDMSKKAMARREVRGCDWTLGGLFKLHRLEVIQKDGTAHPSFDIATPAQAQTLAAKGRP